MNRLCDWQYEINLPLECFLNDPQPGPAGWNWFGWAALAVLIGIGAIMDRVRK